MEWGSKILSNQDESALPFNFVPLMHFFILREK